MNNRNSLPAHPSARRAVFTLGRSIHQHGENTLITFQQLVRFIKEPSLYHSTLGPAVVEINARVHHLYLEAFYQQNLISYGRNHKGERPNDFRFFKNERIEPVKNQLPFFILGGFCPTGHDNESLEFNGCVQIDIDFKEAEGDKKALQAKELLKQDPYIQLLGLSPSRFGVKGIIQTNCFEKERYKDIEAQVIGYLRDNYGLSCDPLSASAACFWFHDREAYVNEKAQVFPIELAEKKNSTDFPLKPIELSAEESSELTLALDALIANPHFVQNADYDEWCTMAYALYNLLGKEQGWYYFQAISARSDKYDGRITARTYWGAVSSRERNKHRERQAGLSTLVSFVERETGIKLSIRRHIQQLSQAKEKWDYCFTVKKHLSEAEEQIKELRKHHKRIAIYMSPGGGKTTLEERLSRDSQHRTCFIFPKVMLLEQFAKRKGNEDIIRIYEHTTRQELDLALTNKRNASTMHSIWKVAHSYGENDTFVLDEGHLLRNGQSYMASACLDIYKLIQQTPANVVVISGTLPVELYRALGFKIIRVERQNEPRVNVRTYTYSSPQPDWAARKYVEQLDFTSNKVHILMLNSGHKQEALVEYVVNKRKLLSAEEVDCVIASKKSSETYQDIVINEKITVGKKLIFITLIGSEGINILNSNIGNMAAFDVKCADTIRQLCRRPRSMDSITLDIFLRQESEDKKDFQGDFNFLLEKELETAQLLANANNTILTQFNDRNPEHFAHTMLVHNLREYLYYCSDKQRLEVNLPGVHFRVKRNWDFLKTNSQYTEELRLYFDQVQQPVAFNEEFVSAKELANLHQMTTPNNPDEPNPRELAPEECYAVVAEEAKQRRRQKRDRFFELAEAKLDKVLPIITERLSDRRLAGKVKKEFGLAPITEYSFVLPPTISPLTQAEPTQEQFVSQEQYQSYKEHKEIEQALQNLDELEHYAYILAELKRLQFEERYIVAICRRYGTSNANWSRFCDKLGYLQRLQVERDGELAQHSNKFNTVFSAAQYRVYSNAKKCLLENFQLQTRYPLAELVKALRKAVPEFQFTSDTKLRHVIDALFCCVVSRQGKKNEGVIVLEKEHSLTDFLIEVYSETEDPQIREQREKREIRKVIFDHFRPVQPHALSLVMNTVREKIDCCKYLSESRLRQLICSLVHCHVKQKKKEEDSPRWILLEDAPMENGGYKTEKNNVNNSDLSLDLDGPYLRSGYHLYRFDKANHEHLDEVMAGENLLKYANMVLEYLGEEEKTENWSPGKTDGEEEPCPF